MLVGRNGEGKTNLVEAVGYLATLSSHRVAGDAPLIRRGATAAIVRAAVVSDDRELRAGDRDHHRTGQPGAAEPGTLGPGPRDLLGVLRTVLFAPEDLALVRGDPSERRRFLDEVLVMRTPRLAGVRADYDRILKQRNTLLKSAAAARRGGDLSTLEVWDEHLATIGAALLGARLALVAELRPYVGGRLRRPGADVGAGRPDLPVVGRRPSRARPAEADAAGRTAGRDRGSGAPPNSTAGSPWSAHTATNWSWCSGPGPARGYASHGESWSFALALRLGSFELLRSDGVDPVLILDDVFAELDVVRARTGWLRWWQMLIRC